MTDQEARQKIARDTGKNYFVDAGAGSGKTTMLVQRMVAMVESGIPVSQICAITFTKAAAREFYKRFQEMLSDRSGENYTRKPSDHLSEPTEETRACCRGALRDIDLCFMGTIDSFCETVLKEHPAEAGITSDTRLATDAEIDAVLCDEYKKIADDPACREEYEQFKNCCSNPKDLFVQGMRQLLEVRNLNLQDYSEVEPNPDDVKKAVAVLDVFNRNEENQMIRDALSALREKAWETDPQNVLNLLEGAEKVTANLTPDQWTELNRKGLLGLLKRYRASALYYKCKKNEFPTDKKIKSAEDVRTYQRLAEIYRENKELAHNYFNAFNGTDNDFAALQAVNNLLNAGDDDLDTYRQNAGIIRDKLRLPFFISLSGEERNSLFEESGNPEQTKPNFGEGLKNALKTARFSQVVSFLEKRRDSAAASIREKGLMSFFDCQYYLRNMLKKDIGSNEGKLCKYIRERHRYFLLDEFQDTNPIQAEIFFYLAAKEPQADWYDCVPDPGSLFIVGDPKQSIYRFRGADVAAYNRVKGLFENSEVGEILTLPNNFRSNDGLKSWFNTVFPGLLQAEKGYEKIQGTYEPIPDTAAAPANVYRYPSGADDPDRVQIIIKNLLDSPDNDCREIMVITEIKDSLSQYAERLYDNGIPFRIEGSSSFSQCPVLLRARHGLACVTDYSDNRWLYGYLKDCAGIPEEEIMNAVFRKGKLDPAAMENCGNAAIKSAVEALSDLRRRARTVPPSVILSDLVEQAVTGGTSLRNLEYAYYALEILRSKEANLEINSYKEACGLLETLLTDKNSDYERCIAFDGEAPRVRLANLHKVKGLEADVVILAAKKQRSNRGRKEYFCISGDNYYPLGLGRGRHNNPMVELTAMTREKETAAVCNDAEKLRLLYVAATRAKKKLIISDVENKACWNELITQDVLNLPENLLPADFAVSDASPARTETQFDSGTVFTNSGAGAPSYRIILPSEQEKRAARRGGEETAVEMPALDANPADACPGEITDAEFRTAIRKDVMGTMVHRLMEVLISSRFAAEPESAVGEIIGQYAVSRPEEAKRVLLDIGEKLTAGGLEQSNGAVKDIFGVLKNCFDRGEPVLCEVPFCRKREGGEGTELVNGVIDLLYRQDGVWHILDWKTNGIESAAHPGVRCDARFWQEHYRSQLNDYREAVKVNLGIEADAYIYHIPVNYDGGGNR